MLNPTAKINNEQKQTKSTRTRLLIEYRPTGRESTS